MTTYEIDHFEFSGDQNHIRITTDTAEYTFIGTNAHPATARREYDQSFYVPGPSKLIIEMYPHEAGTQIIDPDQGLDKYGDGTWLH